MRTELFTSRSAVFRIGAVFFAFLLLTAACGDTSEPAATGSSTMPPSVPQTQATEAPGSTAPAPDTTRSPTTASTIPQTTTAAPTLPFSIELLGTGAIRPLADAPMHGSGCAPGAGALPDGAWFGWVEELSSDSIEFDLACLHTTEPPAVSNDNPALRSLELAAGVTVMVDDDRFIAVDAWSGSDGPVWIYVNDATVTTMAVPTVSFVEAAAAVWEETVVSLRVQGGCCGEEHHGLASPPDPWPAEGLPADGVYNVDVSVLDGGTHLSLVIRRFVRCDDRPEWCMPDYEPDDVALDYENFMTLRIPIDASLVVRMRGFVETSGDETGLPATIGVEASGPALAALVADMRRAYEAFVRPLVDSGLSPLEVAQELAARGAADAEFPYGPTDFGAVAYRGPLGLQIIDWLASYTSPFSDTTQLEIVDRRPIITTLLDQIAG